MTLKPSNNRANGRLQHCLTLKKPRPVRSNIKTMLICVFDVHSEFVPPGQTVNQELNNDYMNDINTEFITKIEHFNKSHSICNTNTV